MRRLALAALFTAAVSAPAHAATMSWVATLDSSQEIPPNASTATGSGRVDFDTATNVLSVNVDWAGLTGVAVQAHIHCCVATPPGNVGIALDLWLPADPSRPATGSYSNSVDLDLVNPFRAAFTTANGGTTAGAWAALMAAMNANEGRAYFNLHTVQFPGGEIRGNLAVPEPASASLLLGGLAVLLVRRRVTRG